MKPRVPTKASSQLDDYGSVLGELVALIESARRAAARSVNAVMTATYFLVGRAIVEQEQKGAKRAAYGEQLLEFLSIDLSTRFGRGFSQENLRLMRLFYEEYRAEISQTLSGKSTRRISQTLSGKSDLAGLAARFPLPCTVLDCASADVADDLVRQAVQQGVRRGLFERAEVKDALRRVRRERDAAAKLRKP